MNVTWYVNRMDRLAKAGGDPEAWLVERFSKTERVERVVRLLAAIREAYAIRLANRAKKAASEADKDECQICGRRIGTKVGVIAHHGYQRPGQGWQTASCFGARFRCYAEASDAIPPYIAIVTNMIQTDARRLKDLRRTPPDSFKIPEAKKRNWHTMKNDVIPARDVPRPPAFDPAATEKRDKYDFAHESYERLWAFTVEEVKNRLRDMKAEKARAEQRLADWRAP